MPLYDADGTKQKPKVRDGIGFYSHATCPAVDTATKRPTYVMVNAPGTYKFSYSNTPATANYITGSVLVDDNGPIKLDISPTAWSQTDAAGTLGDITFVYRRLS